MNTYEVMNEQDVVVNRIVADQAFVEAVYPGRYRLVETPRHVPESVSRAQGKAALILAGAWDAVTQYAGEIEDPITKLLAETALYDTQEWRRDSPFLVECAAALGMSSEDLDELFINAAEIEL